MKNAECRKAMQSRLKPHQCDINATLKPPSSQNRKQKCAQSHPGAKVEGRMQNAETAI
jgi:hypothetical protein